MRLDEFQHLFDLAIRQPGGGRRRCSELGAVGGIVLYQMDGEELGSRLSIQVPRRGWLLQFLPQREGDLGQQWVSKARLPDQTQVRQLGACYLLGDALHQLPAQMQVQALGWDDRKIRQSCDGYQEQAVSCCVHSRQTRLAQVFKRAFDLAPHGYQQERAIGAGFY